MTGQVYQTAAEVAEKLGVSIGTVYYRAKKGEIKSYRKGSRWLFKPEDVDQLVKEYELVPYVPREEAPNE